MRTRPASEDTPCVEFSNVYQHPLMDGSQRPTTGALRREHTLLLSQATRLCGACPLQRTCLTEAVVQFDVAGFAAGTTEGDRKQIRELLGITPPGESLDPYTGRRSGRQVDGDEIYRIRMANPTESLVSIAERLGCSVSTVKRHLRRIRAEAAHPAAVDSVTASQVWAAKAILQEAHSDAA